MRTTITGDMTMRRAFTLIELMIASTLSVFLLAALCVALSGVLRQAMKTNEEMQVMLKASAQRERLLLGTAKDGEKGFHGLLNVACQVATDSKKKTLRVICDDEAYESLPGSKNGFTFGKSSKNGSSSVSITDIAGVKTNAFNYFEKRQRALVYLWVETKAGTVCRMPVAVTVVSEEGS